MGTKLDDLKSRLHDVNALQMAASLMDWDQQCYMPHGGAEARAEHTAALTRMAHEIFVADETQRLVEDCALEAGEGTDDAALLRVVQRDLDVRTKIPAELVAEQSRLATLGHEVWVKARKDNDFPVFAPILRQTVDLSRKIADCLGYTAHPYDPLTDLFEEGATKDYWEKMFATIKEPLVNLVADIQASGNQPDDAFLYGAWDEKSQRAFSLELMEAVGFDMERGRLDIAPHPFCTNFSIGDVRLTTRFLDYLPSAIFGTLHEAGHGMYEQGSPMGWDRLPLAGGVSLGWHESQSRTWENIVGRSKPFWHYFFPKLQKHFPELANVSADTFLRATNKVAPSLIRVEADEVTYNLHIMVRFETECAMIDGTLDVDQVPEFWNAKYQEYLGITPDSDKDGCLQDVHWSGGLLGYFPTYSMGNILSYQLWSRLSAEVGDTDSLMADGNFKPILDWLIQHVYSQGRSQKPQQLLQTVCGEGLNAGPYVAGISAKYRAIYGLA